jgi:hypothetical protein
VHRRLLEYSYLTYSWWQGKDAARTVGNYALTVKAEYLLIAALYYDRAGDVISVEKEMENFRRLKKKLQRCKVILWSIYRQKKTLAQPTKPVKLINREMRGCVRLA